MPTAGDILTDDFNDNDFTSGDVVWSIIGSQITNVSGYGNVVTNASEGQSLIANSPAGGPWTTVWYETELYITSQSSSSGNHIQGFGPRTAGGAKTALVGLVNDGGDIVLRLTYNPDAGQIAANGSTALSTGQWYTVTIKAVVSSGVGADDGTIEVWLHDGTTVSKEFDVSGIDNDTMSVGQIVHGNNFRSSMDVTFRFDDLSVGTAGSVPVAGVGQPARISLGYPVRRFPASAAARMIGPRV